MKSTASGDGGTKSRIRSFVKRNSIVLFLVSCLLFSVVAAVGYAKLRRGEGGPPLPSPSPVAPVSSAQPSNSPSTSVVSLMGGSYNVAPRVETTHWVSWSLLDVRTMTVVGSANWSQPQYVMSMIKPWIAADYLNRHPRPDSWTLNQLTAMIVDSDDQVAYEYFGGGPSLARLVSACGLTDLVRVDWSWSLTRMSARDAVRYGECVYSGKATSRQWTAWIVERMRHVRGDGDFGPRELFQNRTLVATKNGWYSWEGQWYVNCLAVTDDWAISILQRWPYTGGDMRYGIGLADPVCQSVSSQVLKLKT